MAVTRNLRGPEDEEREPTEASEFRTFDRSHTHVHTQPWGGAKATPRLYLVAHLGGGLGPPRHFEAGGSKDTDRPRPASRRPPFVRHPPRRERTRPPRTSPRLVGNFIGHFSRATSASPPWRRHLGGFLYRRLYTLRSKTCCMEGECRHTLCGGSRLTCQASSAATAACRLRKHTRQSGGSSSSPAPAATYMRVRVRPQRSCS